MKDVSLGMIAGCTLTILFAMCCTSNKLSGASEVPMRDSVSEFAYKQTVKVQSRKIEGNGAIVASGFAADKERIITAGHFCSSVFEARAEGVVRKKVDIIYVNNNDEVSVLRGGEIESFNEDVDICIIKREKHGIKPFEILSDYTKVSIHDPVIVVGGPLGFFPVTSLGRVIAPNSKGFPEDINNRLILSVVATYGNSGGPVIDSQGRVIGIIMSKIKDFDHIMIAVKSSEILKFLEKEAGGQ